MATLLKNLLTTFLSSQGEQTKTYKDIEEIVLKVLGKKLKKHIANYKITKNKLIIVSDTASAAFTINLKKSELIQEIKKKQSHIADIIIK